MPQQEPEHKADLTSQVDSTTQPNALFLARLQVEGLFGQYDYDLVPAADYDDTSKLLIFYGENGTGKTTLLWLIHHLLSKTGTGHKSFVAKTKFKRLALWLGSQMVVSATRDVATEGSFVMAIEDDTGRFELPLVADEDGSVRIKDRDQDTQFGQFIGRLPDLNLPFLRDTRRMIQFDEEDEDEDEGLVDYKRDYLMKRDIALHRRIDRKNQSAPEMALRRLTQWVSQQALKGSAEGQLNVNGVYGDIIKRIGSPSPRQKETIQPNPNQLIAILREQSTRTKQFSQYGLTSDLNVDSFIESIEHNKGSKQRLQIIEQILRPFLEGNAARLDAMQQIQTTISNFVASINAFYRNKRLEFNLRTGGRIISRDGRRIPIRKLSSGEQELLLLFCDVLITKKTPTIFIIDEPELSLNITWQRILVDVLLKLATNSQIQFLLATHSIELLAQRRKGVLRLRIEGVTDAE